MTRSRKFPLAADLAVDPRWQVHLDYLRDLQRHARESLARAAAGPQATLTFNATGSHGAQPNRVTTRFPQFLGLR